MLNFYGSLSAEVYDLDKSIGSLFGDVEFYKERLTGVNGDILEPAVGTGRFMIPLLKNGLTVDGFDISEKMLNICREHCKKRGLNPVLTINKMETFSFDQTYEAIVIPAGTFLLLHEREKSIQALKNFYHHLSQRGKLIFDVFLQTKFETRKASTNMWKCENDDTITLESTMVEVDYINQFTVTHNRYEKWHKGNLDQTELERFSLRWYGVEELTLILEGIGFSDIIVSAGYKYGEYPTASDQSITFEAIKK